MRRSLLRRWLITPTGPTENLVLRRRLACNHHIGAIRKGEQRSDQRIVAGWSRLQVPELKVVQLTLE
jgi:hypothetical protein